MNTSLSSADPKDPNQKVAIRYSVEIYVEGLKQHLWHEWEFNVRQYWYTGDEIQTDVDAQRQTDKVKSMFRKQAQFRPIVKYSNDTEQK